MNKYRISVPSWVKTRPLSRLLERSKTFFHRISGAFHQNFFRFPERLLRTLGKIRKERGKERGGCMGELLSSLPVEWNRKGEREQRMREREEGDWSDDKTKRANGIGRVVKRSWSRLRKHHFFWDFVQLFFANIWFYLNNCSEAERSAFPTDILDVIRELKWMNNLFRYIFIPICDPWHSLSNANISVLSKLWGSLFPYEGEVNFASLHTIIRSLKEGCSSINFSSFAQRCNINHDVSISLSHTRYTEISISTESASHISSFCSSFHP